MKLFESLDDLKPFIFRITDNGGDTHDRITVTTCDGDAMLCTAETICANIESVDVQVDADDVEAGTARDLRWIDLSEGLRNRIIANLNEGFANYIESEPAAATRDEARDWQGQWEGYGDERGKSPIYRDGHGFRIRDDENEPVNADQTGEGFFDTFAEAVRWMLPQDYDLSGPEYHTTVNLWDETGGPAPLWDRDNDPPIIDEDNAKARAVIVLAHDDGTQERIAWFAHVADAENFLSLSATIDPDKLHEGKYTIDDLDHPDAED